MKIVNPFGKIGNDVAPLAGCGCSTGSSDTKSTFVCLGNCSCQCDGGDANKSGNNTIGSNKHLW